MLSLIIPLYRSEANLERLFQELGRVPAWLTVPLEVVFVVDGSPDRCQQIVSDHLPHLPFQAQLVSLSRNFGSFSAITAGLEAGRGEDFAVLAADLQEPPELLARFVELLGRDEADIVFGVRRQRSDPWSTRWSSAFFWWFYRTWVIKDMPAGGVDVFACSRKVRDQLVALREVDTNLVALLFWLGFRRSFVPYDRQCRLEGVSAWTFAKRLRYSINSIFNFTDLPVRVLMALGLTGCTLAVVIAAIVASAKLAGRIEVSGYTPIVLAILFFGGLTTFGLGVVGQYQWLTLENARRRPNFIVASVAINDKNDDTVPREEPIRAGVQGGAGSRHASRI